MKTVQFTFVGDGSDMAAQALYTWVVDGGLEDQLIDRLNELTPGNIEVDGITDSNNEDLVITIRSRKNGS